MSAQTFSEFPVPAGGFPAGSPVRIALGPDGNLWFTERVGFIGRITTAGIVTEFEISYASPHGIAAGPDGNLWFTVMAGGESKVCRITTAGVTTSFGSYGEFDNPAGIAAGPDGNLWFTEQSGRISRITTNGSRTKFQIPSGGDPFGIAAGPDRNLWFTKPTGNKIGRITTDGVVTGEFSLPGAGSHPAGIASGSDGNLWFTEAGANKIGRITTAGVITEFSIPTDNSRPGDITAGLDGNLWFTEATGNKIGRITTAGDITEFFIPTVNSGPSGIAAGPDGNLWFTEATGNKIGRLTTPLEPSSCVSDPSTLCLNAGRFQVQGQWQVPSQGTSGDGMAIPLTEDTGAFWFFEPINIEIVVKVLNACSVDGHYWVFAAGLTNVGATLTVTDTLSGGVKTYTNAQGTPFPPIQDTSAFESCP